MDSYLGRYAKFYSQPNPSRSSDFEDLLSSQPSTSMAPYQESTQDTRRPQCSECGTRKMRLRAGQLICKRGHVQQHFRIEQAEDDEFLGDGVARKRRVTKTHKIRTLKSQHTPYHSQPNTDVEPDDSHEDELDQARRRVRKQSRISRARSTRSEEDQLDSDTEDDTDVPYSIRADSFFEIPRSRRSYAASSATEESGFDSEFETAARRSRRNIRTIWRTGVGLHGAFEGRFALLQCLQLILRLQLNKLRELWRDKLPPETEAVARDLWAMFVSLLPVGHYPPEPLIAATFDWHTRYGLSQERAAELFPNHATYDPEAEIRHHRRRMLFNSYHCHLMRKQRQQKSRPDPIEHDHEHSDDPVAAKKYIDWIVGQDENRAKSQSERSSEPESMADPEDELASLDPVFAEERRQQRLSQAERSQSGTAMPGSDSDFPLKQSPPKRKRRRHVPTWANQSSVARSQKQILRLATVPTTISIIYLSLHLLKVPVLWADLLRLISSFKLPYLNAVHQLPLALTRFLNKDDIHHHQLDTDTVPSITGLHLHTLGLADLLGRTYGIEFGEGNVSGQLARLTEGMLLPPTFYVAAKRVLDMVGTGVGPELLAKEKTLPTSFRKAANEEERQTKVRGAEHLQRVPKEFVLMAAMLVVIKMRYGLDGRDRVETLPRDHTSAGISCAPLLEPWLSALDVRRKRHLESPEAVEQIDPAELDALHMSDDQIAAYARFAEDNLILPNQIDLYEWRRLEPARRWASFSDLVPSETDASSQPQPNGTRDGSEREWKSLEFDLRTIYRHHIAQPGTASSNLSDMPPLEAGSNYTMHEFLGHPSIRTASDPLGLCFSPVYPRVIHHANELVGIATPQTPGPALDVAVYLRAHPSVIVADANVLAWETAYGIQAHLEVVERLLEAETAVRADKIRRALRRVWCMKNDMPGEVSEDADKNGEEEEDSGSESETEEEDQLVDEGNEEEVEGESGTEEVDQLDDGHSEESSD